MGWILFIVVGGFVLHMVTKGAESSVKNKIQTEDGNPRIDVKVVQCDNIPQGMESLITCTKNEIIIKSNGYEKKISHQDIVDITIESASQILTNPQFSIGKAAAGVALFGGVGAIAGLSGKDKNELKMMVLSYIKDDEIEYMVFLQQHGKERTVKAEAFLLDRVHKDILEMIKI